MKKSIIETSPSPNEPNIEVIEMRNRNTRTRRFIISATVHLFTLNLKTSLVSSNTEESEGNSTEEFEDSSIKEFEGVVL
ncbi:hypothetical protein RIR_jg25071.t1 [Rhizophagus irregularis DAOM 181602=DAOM 197198]|nr:hypothetical protein RIR_jg25071.t1 [Rhizophagus irregularis DAOM 181602=DAOM 197198]